MGLQAQQDNVRLEDAVRQHAVAATQSARAHRSAVGHSRFVRRLRVGLLIGSLGAIAVIVVMMIFHTFFSQFGGFSASGMFVDGSKITMDKPRLTGARPDGGGYVINADRAIEDITKPNEVDLVNITGDIGGHDRPNVKLSSTSGHYNSAKGTMELFGVVRLNTADYRVAMTSAHVDFKSGVYQTIEPLNVVTTTGMTITADAATAAENATLLNFEGHVKTQIPPRDAGPAAVSEIKGEQP